MHAHGLRAQLFGVEETLRSAVPLGAHLVREGAGGRAGGRVGVEGVRLSVASSASCACLNRYVLMASNRAALRTNENSSVSVR